MEIDGSEDVIYSDDVIGRIGELEDELFEDGSAIPSQDFPDDAEDKALMAEYNLLKSFASQGESCSDWSYGMSFYSESYFPEYAREFFEETNDSSLDINGWPFRHIDWNEAAEELKQDYTEVELDGTTYYGLS